MFGEQLWVLWRRRGRRRRQDLQPENGMLGHLVVDGMWRCITAVGGKVWEQFLRRRIALRECF